MEYQNVNKQAQSKIYSSKPGRCPLNELNESLSPGRVRRERREKKVPLKHEWEIQKKTVFQDSTEFFKKCADI